MTSGKTIGVAGATGALGKELVGVLESAPWNPERLVPLARAASKTAFVTFRDQQVAVDNLGDQALEALDLLVLATPREVARDAGEQAVAAGVPVVDCSGAFENEVAPLVVPWVNPERMKDLPPQAMVSVPGPGALLVSSVLAPLVRMGLVHEAEAHVLLPASAWGQAGIDELSSQVVAMFNSGTPPRKVFDRGLAFDIVPAVGTMDAEGWTSLEREICAQTEHLTGCRTTVTAMAVPVFSGVTASLTIDLAKRAPLELIGRVMEDGGLSVEQEVRKLPRPRLSQSRPFAQVGRIRESSEGRIHFVAALDNLLGTATVASVLAGLLIKGEDE